MMKNPDIIDPGGAGTGDINLLLKQLREKGWKGQFTYLCGTFDPVATWSVVGSLSTGAYTVGYTGISEAPTQAYADFQVRFEKTYGESMYASVPYYYEHALNIFKAIAAANSFDPYKVAATLESSEWDGLFGHCKFVGDELGSPFGIKRVININIPLIRLTTDGKAEIVARPATSGDKTYIAIK